MDDLIGVVVFAVFALLALVAMGVTAVMRGRQTWDVELACARCGSSELDEGPEGIRCRVCGYDPGASISAADAAALRRIQEVGIAITALQSAAREFARSKSYTSGSGTSSKRQGPFPGRYLEGMEQAQEARQIALDLDLELVLHRLAEIPAMERVQDLDRLSGEAVVVVNDARALLEARLTELQAGARSGS